MVVKCTWSGGMTMFVHDDNPRYLTIKEVAKELRVHPLTVNTWLKEGKLEGFKFGKSWRILWEDVIDFGLQGAESN